MTPRQRIDTVIAGRQADRTPIWGGWIASPRHIQNITQTSDDEYWADPFAVSVRAYETLGMDGLLAVFVPRKRGEYRCVDNESFHEEHTRLSLEEAIASIDARPGPEHHEANFDFDTAYAEFRQALIDAQAKVEPMVWAPAQWGIGAEVSCYGEFGYENYFYLVAEHEPQMRKLIEISAVVGRQRAAMLARAMQDGLYPRAALIGEDICTQRGPMVSPAFLEKHFAPALKHGLEPLVNVGARLVWHCDGDVRPLLDMLFDCGIKGLQGFQPECGMDIDSVARRRTADGEKLLIYGPLSVTTELPVLSPDEIRRRTRHAIDVCRDQADLILFTANTITPDIPMDNLEAMYETARTYVPW